MPLNDALFKDSFVNYRITREHEKLFINNSEIVGIQNAQIETTVPYNPVIHLGMARSSTLIRGQPLGNISIQALLVNQDSFIGLTGINPCTGYFVNTVNTTSNLNNIIFAPAYLTSYSLKYSDGQIPEVSASLVSFNSVGSMNPAETIIFNNNATIAANNPSYNLLIPSRSSISLSLNEFNTNRLLDFSIDISIARQPFFSLGNLAPYRVKTNPPLGINASFQIELGDYQLKNFRELVSNRVTQNLTLTISDFISNALISSYSFNNLELVNQGFVANANNNLTVALEYKGYIDL